MENPYEYTESTRKAEPTRLPLPETFLFEEKQPGYFNLKYIIRSLGLFIGLGFVLELIVFVLGFIPFLIIAGLGQGGIMPEEIASLIISIYLGVLGFFFLVLYFFFLYRLPSFHHYRIYNRVFSISHEKPLEGEGMRCCFTAFPRRNKGLRKFLEIADDIGWIGVEEGGLRFQGDHTDLFIPGEMIDMVEYTHKIKKPHPRVTTSRYPRTQITLKLYDGIPFEAVAFREMESRKITEMKKLQKKLHEMLVKLCDQF